MSYLRGPDRSQVQLLPTCVEDYVAPDAPVRFIDASDGKQKKRRGPESAPL